MSEFRYHPILAHLKINEDGSEILMNGEILKISSQKLPHTKKIRKVVFVNRKTINTIRLVCEAWHGIAPTGEHAARRTVETNGDHYSNLYWGKKGMTESNIVGHKWNNRGIRMTATLFNSISDRLANEKLTIVLKELKVNASSYYYYKKKHG
jgi:hypothetical protein